MKDIKLSHPITVTLTARDWFWLLGVLSIANPTESRIIDSLFDQIYDVTE